MISILPSISSITYFATVGLGLPERFALGAAIYPPLASISALAILFEGILTATVSKPPVVSFGTTSFLLNIMVKGPGQYLSASFNASEGMSLTIFPKAFKFEICTIKGLSLGLPFAA